MQISEFQRLILDKYGSRDRQRGTSATFMWFVEEVGELATALAEGESATLSQKESEFADVFAWLCTLANINDVDIDKACRDKYEGNEVTGYK